MNNRVIFTTSQYQDNASTFVQQHGGVVITSCSVSLDLNNLSTLGDNIKTDEIWGLKLSDSGWQQENDNNCGVTYSDSGIESALLQIGTMIEPSIFIAHLTNGVFDEYASLCCTAEIFNKNSNFDVWIIDKDGKLIFLPKNN